MQPDLKEEIKLERISSKKIYNDNSALYVAKCESKMKRFLDKGDGEKITQSTL